MKVGRRVSARDVLLVVQIAICAVLVTSSMVAVRGLVRSLHSNFGGKDDSAKGRYEKALTRWMLRRMDAVIATSERSGAFLEVPYTVVPHGTDFDHFHPARDGNDVRDSSALRHATGVGSCD